MCYFIEQRFKPFLTIYKYNDIQKSSKVSPITTMRPRTILTIAKTKRQTFLDMGPGKHKREAAKTKGDCCFNHIIGLPRKDGIEKSIFDYEKLLYDALLIPEFYNPSKHSFKNKNLWVKKARR